MSGGPPNAAPKTMQYISRSRDASGNERRQFPRPAMPLTCEAQPAKIRGPGLASLDRTQTAAKLKLTPPCRTPKANNKTLSVLDATQNSPSRKAGDKTVSEFSKSSNAESVSTNSPQQQEKIKPIHP